MNKDKDIEKLFTKASFPDQEAEFMHELERKMQVVDMVRGEHGRSVRFYRMFAVVCFVMGLLSGVGLLYFAVMQPVDWQGWLANWQGTAPSPQWIAFCMQYGRLGMSLISCGLIMLGMWPLLTMDTGFNLSAIRIARRDTAAARRKE